MPILHVRFLNTFGVIAHGSVGQLHAIYHGFCAGKPDLSKKKVRGGRGQKAFQFVEMHFKSIIFCSFIELVSIALLLKGNSNCCFGALERVSIGRLFPFLQRLSMSALAYAGKSLLLVY